MIRYKKGLMIWITPIVGVQDVDGGQMAVKSDVILVVAKDQSEANKAVGLAMQQRKDFEGYEILTGQPHPLVENVFNEVARYTLW